MTESELAARKERAENGTFVISQTEEGFRVYSIHNPSQIYLVRAKGERLTCTCPDFEAHSADPAWRCKHVLALASRKQGGEALHAANAAVPPAALDIPLQLLMRRSVSPDGRIDSISVEFSLPVSGCSDEAIKDRALATLTLQKEIVAAFLKLNGSKESTVPVSSPRPARPESKDGEPVLARLLDIGKLDGKYGERLCLNFQVNGRRLRLFGSAKRLAGEIRSAGYEIDPSQVEPGLRLNLACRVVTKPSEDGKYVNVEKVLGLASTAAGDNQ